MALKPFRCKLVTPTASLVDEEVRYVQLPVWDGSMGFLPGRAPIVAALGNGELRLDIADSAKGPGGSRSFFVEGGVAKMGDTELLVLAERASAAETLTLAGAEAELAAAKSPKAGTSAVDARKAVDAATAKVAFTRKAKTGI